MWAADEMIDFTEQGYSNQQEITSVSGTNCTITFDKGTNSIAPKYFTSGTAIRVYGGGYFTVSSTTKTITKIELTFGSSDGSNAITTDVETYSNGTWSGSASSVKFTVGGTSGNRRLASVAVTYGVPDTRTEVNMTDFTAAATTLVKGNTTTTTVTNDQSGWMAAYTYTSSNEEVATVSTNGVITAVAKGTATITATLNVNAEDANYKAGSTKEMAVVITVENPKHTATFYANGTVHHAIDVEEGEAIDFPASDPSDLAGKVFVGWVETKIDGTTDDEPSFVTSADMGTSNVNFYAVFATETDNTTMKTDVLNRELIGVTGTSYSSWSNKKVTSDAVYAGNSAGGNSSIQLRSSNSNSGIVSTTSGGKVKKVVVEWNNNTDDERSLEVWVKNTAYSNASDLYNASTHGTRIGTIKKADATELTIDGDYEYVGLRSASGAMYLTSISITWEVGTVTYSDYCTSVTIPAEITAAGYKTLYCDAALNFEGVDGLEAFIAEKEGTKVNFTKVNSVPAETGVLLKGNAATYQIPVVASSSTDVSTNQLLGVLEDTELSSGIFVLMNGAEGVGFYKTTKAFTVGANTAYLPASVAGAKSFIGFDFGETTGIESLPLTPALKGEPLWFNLAGQRVAQPTKGLYIVNGKKVVVK